MISGDSRSCGLEKIVMHDRVSTDDTLATGVFCAFFGASINASVDSDDKGQEWSTSNRQEGYAIHKTQNIDEHKRGL